jgi:hypothetical protein
MFMAKGIWGDPVIDGWIKCVNLLLWDNKTLFVLDKDTSTGRMKPGKGYR